MRMNTNETKTQISTLKSSYINSNWYLLLTPSSLKVANFRKAYGGGGGCDIMYNYSNKFHYLRYQLIELLGSAHEITHDPNLIIIENGLTL